MRRSKSPFAVHDGTLYIELKESGIHPLVGLTDALPLTSFGRSRVYVTVDQAIAWHEKELRATNGRGGWRDVLRNSLRVLQQVLAQFKEGKQTFKFEQSRAEPGVKSATNRR